MWPALLLAMALSFGAGASLALNNAAVETRTEFYELRAKTETKVKAKTKERYIKVVIEPSGRRTEETSEREVSKAETITAETSTARTTITESSKPAWRVGLQAGATWKEPALQLAGPLVIGVSVEGRIAKSPVSVGAWGSTYGAAGASVSVEF